MLNYYTLTQSVSIIYINGVCLIVRINGVGISILGYINGCMLKYYASTEREWIKGWARTNESKRRERGGGWGGSPAPYR